MNPDDYDFVIISQYGIDEALADGMLQRAPLYPPSGTKFRAPRYCMTPGIARLFGLNELMADDRPDEREALARLAALARFIERHLAGDWGVLNRQDCRANERVLAGREAGRLMSAFEHAGERLWIITDGEACTVMLPEEY